MPIESRELPFGCLFFDGSDDPVVITPFPLAVPLLSHARRNKTSKTKRANLGVPQLSVGIPDNPPPLQQLWAGTRRVRSLGF